MDDRVLGAVGSQRRLPTISRGKKRLAESGHYKAYRVERTTVHVHMHVNVTAADSIDTSEREEEEDEEEEEE